jgi:DNA-binding transcriptional LysR family regulator
MRISNRVVDLVEEGFDVALRVRPTLDDSGTLVVKNFGTSRTLLLASPAQLARQGRPATVADLGRLDTVAMSTIGDSVTWQLAGPDGATHAFQHQPRYVADDLVTLKFAVLAGTGICTLPDYLCAEELRDGRLVNVLPGWAPRPGIFHAVFPSRRGLLPAVRRFLDFLGEAIEREGLAQAPIG